MGNCKSCTADDVKEVFDKVAVTAKEGLSIVKSLTGQVALVTAALEATGVDTHGLGDKLDALNSILDITDATASRLANIRIPTSLKDIADVNGDGQITAEDVLATFENAGSYTADIAKVLSKLKKAGVNTGDAQTALDEVNKVINKAQQVKIAADKLAARKASTTLAQPSEPTTASALPNRRSSDSTANINSVHNPRVAQALQAKKLASSRQGLITIQQENDALRAKLKELVPNDPVLAPAATREKKISLTV